MGCAGGVRGMDYAAMGDMARTRGLFGLWSSAKTPPAVMDEDSNNSPDDDSDAAKAGKKKAADDSDDDIHRQAMAMLENVVPDDKMLHSRLNVLIGFSLARMLPKNLAQPIYSGLKGEALSHTQKVDRFLEANVHALFSSRLFDAGRVRNSLLKLVHAPDRDTSTKQQMDDAETRRKELKDEDIKSIVKFYPHLLACIKVLNLYIADGSEVLLNHGVEHDGIVFSIWKNVLGYLQGIQAVIAMAVNQNIIPIPDLQMSLDGLIKTTSSQSAILESAITEHSEIVNRLESDRIKCEREAHEQVCKLKELRSKLDLENSKHKELLVRRTLQSDIPTLVERNLKDISVDCDDSNVLSIVTNNDRAASNTLMHQWKQMMTSDAKHGKGGGAAAYSIFEN